MMLDLDPSLPKIAGQGHWLKVKVTQVTYCILSDFCFCKVNVVVNMVKVKVNVKVKVKGQGQCSRSRFKVKVIC